MLLLVSLATLAWDPQYQAFGQESTATTEEQTLEDRNQEVEHRTTTDIGGYNILSPGALDTRGLLQCNNIPGYMVSCQRYVSVDTRYVVS